MGCIILSISWGLCSFVLSLGICLSCFISCSSTLNGLRSTLSACSNSSCFQPACWVILWALLIFFSLIHIRFLIITTIFLLVIFALFTLIFRVTSRTLYHITISIPLAQVSFFIAFTTFLPRLNFMVMALRIWSLGFTRPLLFCWAQLLWILRVLLLLLLKHFGLLRFRFCCRTCLLI